VGQFHPLAIGSKNHRMITDHIAAAQGMDTDFIGATRAGFADTAMAGQFGHTLMFGLSQDFHQGAGRATRRILLVAMVHFHHFEVKTLVQDLGGLGGQIKQGVHAD
jgi:hypothetical protein